MHLALAILISLVVGAAAGVLFSSRVMADISALRADIYDLIGYAKALLAKLEAKL